MHRDLYQIIIEHDQINHVKVVEKSENDHLLVWSFSLLGDNKEIYFKEFYTATKFVIVNEDGWLRAFDVEYKEKIFETKLHGRSASAVFSPDHTMLYVGYTKKRALFQYTNHLVSFSLKDFQVTGSWELPDGAYSGHLQMRGDGHVLSYYNKTELSDENEDEWVYEHGYAVFNPITSHIKCYNMKFSPRASRIERKPVIDTTQNIGVMPYWGDVEVQTNAEGERLFDYKIMVFDLTYFNILQILPVRIYKTSDLPNVYNSRKEMAETLEKNTKGEDYEGMLSKFCEDLHSIEFDKNESAVWLCWRGGIVRKTNLNGALSPLLHILVRGQKEFYQPFLTFLERVERHFLIVETNDDSKYKLPLTDVDLTSQQELIPVEAIELKIVTEDPVKEKQLLEERCKVVISVDDLNHSESLLFALDQMIRLTEDIAALGFYNRLAFLVKDNKGLAMDDCEFFKKAIPLSGAAEKIKQVVDNFINYDGAQHLYIDSEKTALCYAVYELASHSPVYIETALRYLEVIDEEHDVFNVETLLPMLMDIYKGTEHKARILKTLNDISTGWWVDCLQGKMDMDI